MHYLLSAIAVHLFYRSWKLSMFGSFYYHSKYKSRLLAWKKTSSHILGLNTLWVFVSCSWAATCIGRKKEAGVMTGGRAGGRGGLGWSGNGVGKSNLFFIRCWDGMSYIMLCSNFVPVPGSQKMKEKWSKIPREKSAAGVAMGFTSSENNINCVELLIQSLLVFSVAQFTSNINVRNFNNLTSFGWSIHIFLDTQCFYIFIA